MTRPASSGHWGLPGDATSELRPEGSLGGGQRGRALKELRAAADTAGSFSSTCPGSTGTCNTHSHTHMHTQDEGPSLDSWNAKDLTQPPRQSLALPPHHLPGGTATLPMSPEVTLSSPGLVSCLSPLKPLSDTQEKPRAEPPAWSQ